MPICRKCNNRFPTKKIINNRERNLNKRKYCLDCSPFGLHNTKKIHFINLRAESNKLGVRCICEFCKREYTYTKKKKGHTLINCNSCKTNKQRFDKKRKALEYKGNKCQRCGYNKCIGALHFHHRDPSTKSFIIGGSHCYSWEKIKTELDKCDLICSNCHAEEHYVGKMDTGRPAPQAAL